MRDTNRDWVAFSWWNSQHHGVSSAVIIAHRSCSRSASELLLAEPPYLRFVHRTAALVRLPPGGFGKQMAG
jgi:hypothetical protein